MSSSPALYRDPTFEAACELELREKRCEACEQSLSLVGGKAVCSQGLKWPACRSDKKRGFRWRER